MQAPDCTDGLLQNFYALHINSPLSTILLALAAFSGKTCDVDMNLSDKEID